MGYKALPSGTGSRSPLATGHSAGLRCNVDLAPGAGVGHAGAPGPHQVAEICPRVSGQPGREGGVGARRAGTLESVPGHWCSLSLGLLIGTSGGGSLQPTSLRGCGEGLRPSPFSSGPGRREPHPQDPTHGLPSLCRG